MALIVDGGRIPPRWLERKGLALAPLNSCPDRTAEFVRIALVNNMPDSALEDTEMQFMELLAAGSGDIPVQLSLFSLPRIPRNERAQRHLQDFYRSTNDLWDRSFDAAIITGTEPRQPDLRQEPYWQPLTEVFDWAERHTVSTILSCLAAHAGVLYSDGIQRRPLGDKRFGVFASQVAVDHALTRNVPPPICFPHSRWNEVPEDALSACGYSILTRSAEAGADLFVKRKKKSLFVHFQGHPEYEALTLLKEYRRDIKRFLRQERNIYPTVPHGYFDATTAKLLGEFQATAVAGREEQMLSFPERVVARSLQHTWQCSASRIYRNWLQYVWSRKNERASFAAMAEGSRRPTVPATELI